MLKTLKRKIALVAAAGLGFGILSTVPAFAAAGDITDLAVNTDNATANVITSAETGGILSSATARAGDCISLTVTFSDANDGGAITVTTSGGTNLTSTTCADTSAGLAADNDNATVDNDTAENVSFVAPSTIGNTTIVVKHTLTTGATVRATQSFTLTTVGAPATVVATGRTTIVTNGTAPADNSADATFNVKLKDAYGNYTILDENERIVFSSAVVSEPGGVTTTQAQNRPSLIEATAADAGGVSYDEGSLDGSANGEFDHRATPATGVNVFFENTTVGGRYTATFRLMDGAVIITDKTIPINVLDNTSGLTGTVTWVDDAAEALTTLTAAQGDVVDLGQPTFTAADGSTISGAAVAFTVSPTTGGTLDDAADTTGTDGSTNDDPDLTVDAAATGTITVTASVATGASSSINASVTITVVTSIWKNDYDVALEATATGSTFKELTDVAATDVDTAAASATYNLNPTVDSMSMEIVVADATAAAISGATIGVTIADNGASIADDTQLSVSSATLTTDSSGKATVTAKNVTPANNESYVVTFKSGSNTLGTITVTYANAAATTTTFDTTTKTVKIGSVVAADFKVTDQYGAPWAGKDIAWSRSGANVAKSGTATTDSAGKVSYSWTDAALSVGATDVFSVTAPAATLTITYSSSDPVVASFSWGYSLAQNGTYTAFVDQTTYLTAIATANNNNLAGAVFEDAKYLPIDTSGDYTNTGTGNGANTAAHDELVQLRITAKSAGGTALAGVKVKVTASAGAKIIDTTPADSIEKYTDASGNLAFTVFSTKIGDASWTVEVGTVKSTFTTPYLNDVDDARILTMKTAPTTTTAGNVVQYIALVKDRYGNPVAGDSVVFTESGAGRLEGSTTITTDAAGEALVDFSTLSTESGAGKVIATIAGSQVANTAGKYSIDGLTGTATDFTTDAAAGVATLTTNVTVTAAAASTEIATVKEDAKVLSASVTTLAKAVTSIQNDVTELTNAFAAQIKSLSSAIAKISRAIAALSKRIK